MQGKESSKPTVEIPVRYENSKEYREGFRAAMKLIDGPNIRDRKILAAALRAVQARGVLAYDGPDPLVAADAILAALRDTE